MNKNVLLAVAFSGLIPVLFLAVATVLLHWTSLGFSINPSGLVIEWGVSS